MTKPPATRGRSRRRASRPDAAGSPGVAAGGVSEGGVSEGGVSEGGVSEGGVSEGRDFGLAGTAAATDARREGGAAGTGVDATGADQPSAGRWERWRQRPRQTLHAIRANPTGRIALKLTIALAGALVVAIGLVLIPLPGPGWALVILGLAIWAVEFVWAKHLLGFTRTRLQRWTNWVRRRSLPMRLLLGFVGLVFVGVVVALSLKFSFGIDVISKAWTYVMTH